jgi:hypothetical protein
MLMGGYVGHKVAEIDVYLPPGIEDSTKSNSS